MPREENTHNRPQEFSYWHRPFSLSRFLKQEDADKCYMSDLDSVLYLEWCGDHKPLCFFEVARDIGQDIKGKNSKALENLSRNSLNKYPVFVVLYKVMDSDIPNSEVSVQDIENFKVRQVAPVICDIGIKTPQEFAELVWQVREHYRKKFYSERKETA